MGPVAVSPVESTGGLVVRQHVQRDGVDAGRTNRFRTIPRVASCSYAPASMSNMTNPTRPSASASSALLPTSVPPLLTSPSRATRTPSAATCRASASRIGVRLASARRCEPDARWSAASSTHSSTRSSSSENAAELTRMVPVGTLPAFKCRRFGPNSSNRGPAGCQAGSVKTTDEERFIYVYRPHIS